MQQLSFTDNTSKKQTWLYFLSYMLLGAIIASLGPTLHYLAEHTQTPVGNMGAVFSFRSLGYLVGSFTIGRLFDKISGHKLLSIIIGASLVLFVSLIFLPTFWALVSLIFLLGFGLGGLDVGSNTLLAWVHRHRSGPFLNAMFFFAGIGSILSPFIISTFDTVPEGDKFAYLLIAGLGIPAFILALTSPSPTKSEQHHQNDSRPIPLTLFCSFGILFFLYIGAEVSFSGWLHTYLMDIHLGNAQWASRITSLFWFAITLGRMIMVPLSNRYKAGSLIPILLSSAIVSISLFIWLPVNPTTVFIAVAGLGISIASIFPITFSLTEQLIPITGARNGILWAAGSAGAIFLPFLIGKQMDALGTQRMPWIILGIYSIALIVFLYILWKSPSQNGK